VKALELSPALVRLDEDKVLSSRFYPVELIGPDISQKELEHCLATNNTYAPSYKGVKHPEVGGIQFSAAYHNPTLALTYDEYFKFYSILDGFLQGGIYLNHNNISKASSLEEVWNVLRDYGYAFDGKAARVVKREQWLP